MTRMISIGAKVQQIAGLLGTKDINEWESRFIASVYAWTEQGKSTTRLSCKQIEAIERIYEKHFA